MTAISTEAVVEHGALLGEVRGRVAETINWHSSLGIGDSRYSTTTRSVKRFMDVIVAALLLVVLAPLFALLVLLIRLDSSGPAFFRQTRIGFLERPFTIWKFRTMTTDNDDREHRAYVTAMLRGEADNVIRLGKDGKPVFKLAGDPRITRIGAFLRRTSLDELPQLINVLNGTMSLVGPRPSLDYEIVEYTRTQRLRASAMPGMTGLWQVEGRSSMAMNEALALDIRYIQTCSLAKDVRILARTTKVVFGNNTGY